MKYFFTLFLMAGLLFSCEPATTSEQAETGLEKPGAPTSEKPGSSEEASPRNKKFNQFLDKLPDITLPFQYLTCREGTENTVIFGDHNPTPYLDGYTYVKGKFPLKNGQVAVVTLAGADCMIPVLTTFAPDGQEISEETITMGRCGPGPCFECLDYTIIRSDLSIYFSDTIVTSDCDDNFEPIPGTTVKKVLYQEGEISPDGKINLSGDLEKILE